MLHTHHFTTQDGARLHYLEAGHPHQPPLVMIPGGGQAAESFQYQFEGLKEHYHLFAIDMRGHGESEDPGYGYRISRFSKDLAEFLAAQKLKQVTLLGHSLGCSVIWSYWDTFGSQHLSKLILVDESPTCMADPAWSEQQRRQSGATFTFQTLYETLHALKAQPEQTLRHFIDTLVTHSLSSDKKDWMVQYMLKMPISCMVDTYFNNITQDWRDVIPRIDIPTLVIGGKVSAIPWESQVWIHKHISHSRLEIFEEHERGSHFMFIENSDKFNAILIDFLG